MVNLAFAKLVEEAVGRHLETYRYLSTSKGSGPILTFERAAAPSRPRLREQVQFQKGLHGGEWFRVNVHALFDGQAKAGAGSHQVGLVGVGTSIGPDVRFSTRAELESWLEGNLEATDRRIDDYFRRFDSGYGALEALLAHFIELYAAWFRAEGAALPLSAFRQEKGNVDLAYERFKQALAGLGLIKIGTPTNAWSCAVTTESEAHLWRSWTKLRPRRPEEFFKGEHYDCSVCGKFMARSPGRLIHRDDPYLGAYAEFVCSRC